jgi:transposase
MRQTNCPKWVQVSKRKFNLIIKCFSTDITSFSCSEIVALNRKTTDKYYNFFRKIIIEEEEKERDKFQVDKSEEAEIDESYFGAKRVRGKRGRGAGGKIAVVGILKRKNKVFLSPVTNCSKEILLPIILDKIEVGSGIFTDGWKSYQALALYGFTHKTVNHDDNQFVKDGNIHVNGIESCWSYTKRRLSKFNGLKKQEFENHLKESEWRFNYRDKIEERLKFLIKKYFKKV